MLLGPAPSTGVWPTEEQRGTFELLRESSRNRHDAFGRIGRLGPSCDTSRVPTGGETSEGVLWLGESRALSWVHGEFPEHDAVLKKVEVTANRIEVRREFLSDAESVVQPSWRSRRDHRLRLPADRGYDCPVRMMHGLSWVFVSVEVDFNETDVALEGPEPVIGPRLAGAVVEKFFDDELSRHISIRRFRDAGSVLRRQPRVHQIQDKRLLVSLGWTRRTGPHGDSRGSSWKWMPRVVR